MLKDLVTQGRDVIISHLHFQLTTLWRCHKEDPYFQDFDVLGWFAPTTVNKKILLQRVREFGINWDDAVPDAIRDVWLKWKPELPSLSVKGRPHYYAPKESNIVSTQLHGFTSMTLQKMYMEVSFTCDSLTQRVKSIYLWWCPWQRFYRSSDWQSPEWSSVVLMMCSHDYSTRWTRYCLRYSLGPIYCAKLVERKPS